MTRNGLSVDLEDWFSLVRRRLWSIDGAPTERVVSATRVLLDLLDETGTKATFFVLGRVAETFPDLVRDVAAHARLASGPNSKSRSSRARRRGGRARKAFCIATKRRARAPLTDSSKRSGSGSNS